MRLWDTASGAELHTLRGHTTSWVSSVAFAPNGQRLASGSGDKTVRIWDPLTSQESFTIPREQYLQVPGERHLQVACSGDGRFIATAGRYNDRTVIVWDAPTAKQLVRLRGHTAMASCVAFRPDSRYLASAGEDKTVKVWDTSTWKEVTTLRGHGSEIIKLAYSPDGKRLATASFDTTVNIWDPATGQVVQVLRGHAAAVNSVAFSPAGDCLATASEDKTIRIWKASTGQTLHTLHGHVLGVISVAFDLTWKRLATGGRDATVKVWNVATGQLGLYLQGPYGHCVGHCVQPRWPPPRLGKRGLYRQALGHREWRRSPYPPRTPPLCQQCHVQSGRDASALRRRWHEDLGNVARGWSVIRSRQNGSSRKARDSFTGLVNDDPLPDAALTVKAASASGLDWFFVDTNDTPGKLRRRRP